MDQKYPLGCQLPGCKKVVFYDSILGKHHQYCSYGHAKRAHSESSNYNLADSNTTSKSSSSDNICKLPGCNRPRYVNKSADIIYEYCGKTHANKHKLNDAQLDTKFQMNSTNSEDQELYLAIELSLQNHDAESKLPATNFWSCKICTFDNPSLENECAICNESRSMSSVPLPIPPYLQPTKSDSKHASNNSNSTSFHPSELDDIADDDFITAIALSITECTSSQQLNQVGSDHLSSNSLVVNQQSPSSSSTFPSMIPAPPPPVPSNSTILNQLSCQNCTLLVSPDHPTCSRCHSHVEKEWMCRNCTFDNSVKDSHCSMCGNSCVVNQLTGSSSQDRSASSVSPPQDVHNATKCGLPGCPNSAVHYGYCSEDHRSRALDLSMLVPAEDGVERVFVGSTGDFTAHLLTRKHDKHKKVKAQFLQSWSSTDEDFPRVERIYWIRVNPILMEAYQTAANNIGNVERHFHGTAQHPDCMFGTNQAKPPCSGVDCKVCSICKSSFDRSFAATGGGTRLNLRYGTGLYFSPISSKSNGYNILSERIRYDSISKKDRRWRCMFLCNVVLGKSFVTQEGFLPDNQCPPPGYDSVTGEVGQALNHPEVVVYQQDQAIPSFLIVYSLPILE